VVKIVDYIDSDCFEAQFAQSVGPMELPADRQIRRIEAVRDGVAIAFAGRVAGLSIYIEPAEVAEDQCPYKLIRRSRWISMLPNYRIQTDAHAGCARG
jgi:hypothetical protein